MKKTLLFIIPVLTLCSLYGQQNVFMNSRLVLQYEEEDLKDLDKVEKKFVKKANKYIKTQKSQYESFYYPLFPGDWSMPLTSNEMEEFIPEKSEITDRYLLSVDWNDDLTKFDLMGFSRMYKYLNSDKLLFNGLNDTFEAPIYQFPLCQMQLHFIDQDEKDLLLEKIKEGVANKAGRPIGHDLYARTIEENESVPQFRTSTISGIAWYYIQESIINVYHDPLLSNALERKERREVGYIYEHIYREDDFGEIYLDSVPAKAFPSVEIVERWSLSVKFKEGEYEWPNSWPYMCKTPGYLPVLIREPVALAVRYMNEYGGTVQEKTFYYDYNEVMEKIQERKMNRKIYETVLNAQLMEKLDIKFESYFDY